MAKRTKIPINIRRAVLTEAGYRCAVPTCRTILALELHHIEEVKDGGGNTLENLIALCPTCHTLYTQGTITKDSIYAYKTILVSLNGSFDVEGINNLLFLAHASKRSNLIVSGDGVLKFSALVASGYADYQLLANNGNLLVTYKVGLTEKGAMLVNAWLSGNRTKVEEALGVSVSDSVTVTDSVEIRLNGEVVN